MNKTLKLIIASLAVFTAGSLHSCKLDEKNLATVSLDRSFSERSGFEGLINGAYAELYFLHGKVDYAMPTEGGTDIWVNTGNNGAGFALYDHRLVTTDGNLKVIWGSSYASINLCNTAIHFGKDVKGYGSEEEFKAKLAEAYFLRAFFNFVLVEQFGNVVLRTKSSTADGVENTPKRNTEQEFYDLIIADLKYACDNLPVKQSLRGRATKKAAYGLLAKVYLQRTRLGQTQEYARLALETAEHLINNAAQYGTGLYTSDNTKSGFAKLWEGANNKNNTEFLFVQAIDHTAGLNPEWYNRGRTRQFYVPDLGGRGAEWGTREGSPLYSRSNSRVLKPSHFLLTQCFDPAENTPDTRFKESFTYKFYAAANKTITQAMVDLYKKDPSLVGHVIQNTSAKWPAQTNYFQQTMEEQVNMNSDQGLAIFTPNWNINVNDKKMMPYLVADPSDIFDASGNYKIPANYPDEVNLVNIYPALKKFSAPLYAQSNQYWMGDIAIIRLGDIYLTAAEAAILYNNDQNKAAGFINTIRRRAAVTSRQNEMEIAASQVNIDFILKERARELAGEHMRWTDLKRTGRLTKSYLQQTNSVSATNFDEAKHTKRPIPQSFLDAISNTEEFGNNGY